MELCIVERELYDGAAAWRAAEAALVAGRVRAAIDADGYEPRDVVVLLRSGTDVRIYEDALAAEGLPTASAIGRGFWGRQQVLDLLAYLRLIRNRYDDNALLSVLASPLVGVSNDALLRTRRAARAGSFFGLRAGAAGGLAGADLNLLVGLPPALRPPRRGLRRARAGGAARAHRQRARLRPGLPAAPDGGAASPTCAS